MVAIFCDYQSRDFERRDAPLGLRRDANAFESACGAVEAALVAMRTRLSAALARARVRARAADLDAMLPPHLRARVGLGVQMPCHLWINRLRTRRASFDGEAEAEISVIIIRESQSVDEYEHSTSLFSNLRLCCVYLYCSPHEIHNALRASRFVLLHSEEPSPKPAGGREYTMGRSDAERSESLCSEREASGAGSGYPKRDSRDRSLDRQKTNTVFFAAAGTSGPSRPSENSSAEPEIHYRVDANCDDVLEFHASARELLLRLEAVRRGALIFQDKTSALAVAATAQLVPEGGDVLVVNDVSGLTALHLLSALQPTGFDGRVLICNVFVDALAVRQLQNTLEQLGVNGTCYRYRYTLPLTSRSRQ